MAREYAKSDREYAPGPKFTPDEDAVYSPEGVPLVTPSTMEAPAGGETAAKVLTDVVSSPVRAGLAVAKPFADIAKWAGYGEPVEALKQADVGIKKQGPEALGIQSPLSTVSSLAGDLYGLKGLGTIGSKLLAPAEAVIPAIETASKWLATKPAMQSILGGGGIGVLGADPNAGSAVTEGAMGAALAGATHGLIKGGGAMLDPALARLKELEQLGYDKAQIIKDSTLGQLLGGGMQKVENFLNAIPFSGVSSKINEGVKSFKNMTEAKLSALDAQKAAGIDALDLAAQKTKDDAIKALEARHMQKATDMEISHAEKAAKLKEEESAFHRPFIDRALSYLGPDYALKPNLKGHELLSEGQKNLSKAYEDALKDIGNMRLPKQTKKELQDVVDADVTALGGEGSKLHKLLTSKVDSLLATANKGNWLSPQNWQDQLSALSKEAYKSKGSQDPFVRNYGHALDDLKDKWTSLIEDTAGSELFKNANKAFSEFKIPEKAASYMSSLKNAGEFNPNDLLKAIASESSTKRLAGGESELQQLAQKGYADMMAKRQALEDAVKTGKKTLAEQHKAEQDLLDQYHDLTARNIKMRKNALAAKTDVEKDVLSKTAKDVESHPVGSYGEHRAMYNLSGMGALTGGGMAASHFLSLPPELQAALGGTLLAGTHALYNRPVQTLLKKAATAERPEWMKQVGQALKENAPLGALTAVENYESMRKKPRAGVTVYDPNTGNQISPAREYSDQQKGNLPQFEEGGGVKKPSAGSIAGVFQEVGPVQGPNLGSMWSEHLASVPKKFEENQRNQMELLGKAFPGNTYESMMTQGDPKAMAELATQVPFGGMIAYHGTPHNIKGGFDMSKVGTGEGAQAYGHGMYFAENPSVARGYTAFDPAVVDLRALLKAEANSTVSAKDFLTRYIKEHEENNRPLLASHYKDMLKLYNRLPNENDNPVMKFIKSKFMEPPSLGNLYKVDIPDEIVPKMVNWDKPFAEQPQNIKEAFSKFDSIAAKDPERNSIYLQRWFREPSTAKKLKDMGYEGFQYLDQGSRRAGEGTSNYVVFDPTQVKILGKE